MSDDANRRTPEPGCVGLEPELFDVVAAFRRLMRANRQMMATHSDELGVHPGQISCLRELVRHPDISQRELSEALHLAPPTITVMLQKMERMGLVERHTDGVDQRLMRIRLTDFGATSAERLHASHIAYAQTVIGPMTADDRREFERLLNIVSDNLEAAIAKIERRAPSR